MQFHTTSSTDISPKDESQKNTVLKGNRKRNKKPRGRSVLKFIITAIFTITFGFVINYLWLEYQKPNLSIQFSIGTEYRQNSFEKDQTIYYQVLTDNLRDCIVTRAMTSGDNRVFGRIDETAEVFIIFIIKNDGRSHINKFRLGLVSSILGVAKLETSPNIMGSFHESEVDYSKRLFKINIESIPSNTQAVVTLHFSLSEAEYITLKEKNELDIKCVYLTTNELGAKKIEIFGYSLKKALDIYRQSFGSNALIDMELKVNVMENNLSDEERTSITRLFEDEGSELVYNTTCNCSDNIKLKKHKLLINY